MKRLLHRPARYSALDLAAGVLASIGAVVLVSLAIEALRPYVPVLSLGVLYVFAVLPIAVAWGLGFATAVSIASMLAFNWFFLPPKHTLQLRDGANWLALAVYLVTAVVVSALAARARRRRDDAEQRRREADVLAEAAGDLLRGIELEAELERLAELAAGALRVEAARIELGEPAPRPGERGVPLRTGRRTVATLFVDAGDELDAAVEARFLPALAALLAVAVDRAELEAEALEAEMLRRSDAVKTALLRSVSHDLRSPLTAILASAGALANEELRLSDADQAELVAAIREEATRLDRVVRDLLDLSRLEAGVAEPHLELWSIDELVGQALDVLYAGGDRIIVELDPEAPPVNVDAGQIERVLANLIENALKYSPDSEPVHVQVTSTAAEVLVRVVDHGQGIRPGDRDRIFEPFQRGTNDGVRGAGLGLAIARGFAEANGGRLWAESREGQGAAFVLALPAEVKEHPA